ncbi:MAG: hypothetical protein FWB98_05070, partial [Defluviitaleaceae bacterium]|nr:hypothetical protein [Defluviitaleaceae bacterium]
MKTLKRIAAFCLAVLMTMSIVPITNLSAQPEVDTREGFTLVPTAFGQTGIETTSAFVLTTPTDTMPNLSIDGQPSPAINRTEANRFYITPATPLRANTVYIFRVARANEPDITWAFQTAKNFEILSTLPGNQGAFVPVNVGIEVNFSLGAEVDLESHFTIYPHVEGWFVYDGNTTVFMPISPLAYSTIYTVTIDGDLGLANSAQTLGQDFIFSFETMPQTEEEVEAAFQPRTQVQFTENFVEFPSFEPARIGFRLISNTWDNIPDTEFRVYRFEDLHQAADAVNQIAGIPSWSHFAQIRSLVDTEGLAHVLSFEAESPIRWQTAQASLPEVLPPGFYLINATVGEDSVPRQMVMQITNLAVQVVADDTSAIVWVNHMTTGEPAIGAEIWSSVTENLYTADDDGISVINRGIGDGTGDMLHITAEAEEVAVFFPGWNAWGRAVSPSWGIPNDNYWSVLQLDRTLFSPRDTVSFWGFASPRNGNENTGYLTATIAQGFDIMHREAVATENGGFHGEITLPNLTPGGYNLTISYGDTNITQIFFTVEDFVLPPYQMHTTADQVAVFIGEEATFNVRSEFFEGTPVAELEVIYGFFGSNLQTNAQGQGQTDINGNFARPTGIIQPSGTAQGQATLTFRTEATLPEIGRTFRQASVRVFINDINVAVETSRQGADATVAVNVHEITLDRLNNGTNTHFNDFLADPVPGQALSAAVSRIYWVAERTGEVYDFIQRRVVPVYRHNRHEEIIDRFSLTTDADGYARHDFTVPDRLHESYRITITTTDGNGRTITHQRFIGRDWSSFHWDANDNQMNLHQEQEGDVFAIGDEINLTVRRGVEPLIQGRTLFVMVQNGILTHHVGDNYFDFEFEGGHVPNIAVHAFYFNGHTYYNSFRMTRRIRFDTAERNLNIEITADQESYRPSGTATLTITTTDNEG